MGHQIMRQPDGRLCVFSTEFDEIIVADATPDELLDMYAKKAADQARKDTQRVLDAVLAGNPRSVYYQFARTYDEAVAQHRKHGGDESMVHGTPQWRAAEQAAAAVPAVPPLDLTPCPGCGFSSGGISANCAACAARHPDRYAAWVKQLLDDLDEMRAKMGADA